MYMCKKMILVNYLEQSKEKFKNIVYMRDGLNYYCPRTLLTENDILFPRVEFPLCNKINN